MAVSSFMDRMTPRYKELFVSPLQILCCPVLAKFPLVRHVPVLCFLTLLRRLLHAIGFGLSNHLFNSRFCPAEKSPLRASTIALWYLSSSFLCSMASGKFSTTAAHGSADGYVFRTPCGGCITQMSPLTSLALVPDS